MHEMAIFMKRKIYFELGEQLKLLFHPLTLYHAVIHPHHDTISLYKHTQLIGTQIVYYHAWFNIQWTAMCCKTTTNRYRYGKYLSIYTFSILSIHSPDEWSSSSNMEQHIYDMYMPVMKTKKRRKKRTSKPKQNGKRESYSICI